MPQGSPTNHFCFSLFHTLMDSAERDRVGSLFACVHVYFMMLQWRIPLPLARSPLAIFLWQSMNAGCTLQDGLRKLIGGGTSWLWEDRMNTCMEGCGQKNAQDCPSVFSCYMCYLSIRIYIYCVIRVCQVNDGWQLVLLQSSNLTNK